MNVKNMFFLFSSLPINVILDGFNTLAKAVTL